MSLRAIMKPERAKRMQDVLLRRQADLVLVLEDIEDPHNIGAIMRSADSVGVQDIYLIETGKEKKDFAKKRSARSAEQWVTLHRFTDVASCTAALKARNLRILATHLGSNAVSLFETNLTEPCALVFGNERKGISPEMLAAADGNFIIPQVGMIRSLNISVACAVSLYEAFRQRQAFGLYEPEMKLPQAQQAAVLAEWTERYPKEEAGE